MDTVRILDFHGWDYNDSLSCLVANVLRYDHEDGMRTLYFCPQCHDIVTLLRERHPEPPWCMHCREWVDH